MTNTSPLPGPSIRPLLDKAHETRLARVTEAVTNALIQNGVSPDRAAALAVKPLRVLLEEQQEALLRVDALISELQIPSSEVHPKGIKRFLRTRQTRVENFALAAQQLSSLKGPLTTFFTAYNSFRRDKTLWDYVTGRRAEHVRQCADALDKALKKLNVDNESETLLKEARIAVSAVTEAVRGVSNRKLAETVNEAYEKPSGYGRSNGLALVNIVNDTAIKEVNGELALAQTVIETGEQLAREVANANALQLAVQVSRQELASDVVERSDPREATYPTSPAAETSEPERSPVGDGSRGL